MGRRYYCDYCDKAFADNATNRRNHLNGVQHRTMRKLHYDSFQDPEIILSDDANKRPCRQFHQAGECKFGSACKYSHLNPEDRERLKALVAAQQAAKKSKRSSVVLADGPEHLAEWLAKRSKLSTKNSNSDQSVESKHNEDCAGNTSSSRPCVLPSVLNGMLNLPISLLPPDQDVLRNAEISQWG